MKNYLILLIFIVFGCKNSTDSDPLKDDFTFPLAIGNYWDYTTNKLHNDITKLRIDSNHYVFQIKEYANYKWKIGENAIRELLTYKSVDTLRFTDKKLWQFYAKADDGVYYGRLEDVNGDTTIVSAVYQLPNHPIRGNSTTCGKNIFWYYMEAGSKYPLFRNDTLIKTTYPKMWQIGLTYKNKNIIHDVKSGIGVILFGDSTFLPLDVYYLSNYELK